MKMSYEINKEYIYKKGFGKKGGRGADNKPKESTISGLQNSCHEITSPDEIIFRRWPKLQDPDYRELVRALLRACGLPETSKGVRMLEIRYSQIGFDLWRLLDQWVHDPIPVVRPGEF